MLPCVAQALASESVRSRRDRLIRLCRDDIVQLLFVLRGEDDVVGSLSRRLVCCRGGSLLEFGLVLANDLPVVELYHGEGCSDEQQDAKADYQRLDELGWYAGDFKHLCLL